MDSINAECLFNKMPVDLTALKSIDINKGLSTDNSIAITVITKDHIGCTQEISLDNLQSYDIEMYIAYLVKYIQYQINKTRKEQNNGNLEC